MAEVETMRRLGRLESKVEAQKTILQAAMHLLKKDEQMKEDFRKKIKVLQTDRQAMVKPVAGEEVIVWDMRALEEILEILDS